MKNKRSEKLKNVQLLLLDVDGVLTDGRIIYDDAGSQVKEFNVRDGLGIKLVIAAGIKVGIVTGRKSNALHHRCRDLGIQYVYEDVSQKGRLLEKIIEQTGVGADRTAFVGDDIPDLGLMRRVGLSIAVADAHELVKKSADWITTAAGGCGAVREVCEALLKTREVWEKVITAEEECIG
jgi:3-deoxy-D-manno-octulosonate 8-phosphate phosphatase (KDO 8-P phosphatase)